MVCARCPLTSLALAAPSRSDDDGLDDFIDKDDDESEEEDEESDSD